MCINIPTPTIGIWVPLVIRTETKDFINETKDDKLGGIWWESPETKTHKEDDIPEELEYNKLVWGANIMWWNCTWLCCQKLLKLLKPEWIYWRCCHCSIMSMLLVSKLPLWKNLPLLLLLGSLLGLLFCSFI